MPSIPRPSSGIPSMPRPTIPALVRPSSGGVRPTAPTGFPSEDPGVGPEGEGGNLDFSIHRFRGSGSDSCQNIAGSSIFKCRSPAIASHKPPPRGYSSAKSSGATSTSNGWQRSTTQTSWGNTGHCRRKSSNR